MIHLEQNAAVQAYRGHVAVRNYTGGRGLYWRLLLVGAYCCRVPSTGPHDLVTHFTTVRPPFLLLLPLSIETGSRHERW